jgi:hypothetical protein
VQQRNQINEISYRGFYRPNHDKIAAAHALYLPIPSGIGFFVGSDGNYSDHTYAEPSEQFARF